MSTNQKEFLSTAEAANFLNVSLRQIRELTSKRKIRYYQPGGRLILFRRSDLIEYIESGLIEKRRELSENYERELIRSML